MDALPTYNYLALTITCILYYYLLFPSDVFIASGETKSPRPSHSIIDNNKRHQTLGPVKHKKNSKTPEGPLK